MPVARAPYLLLILPPLFWASNWIVGRGFAVDIPPLAMTFLRWLFAVLILAPFAAPHLREDWPVVRQHWRAMLLFGVFGVGMNNAFTYVGLNYTTATNGVLLHSFLPVMIIAISWVVLKQRLSLPQVAGVILSLGGVLTILCRGNLGLLASFHLNIGDMFVIGSMLMWSVYTVGLRWHPVRIHLLTFLFVIACIGDLAVLPFFAAEFLWVRRPEFTLTNISALLFVSVFSSILAYIFWNRGVALVGANVAGLFVHLMPAFGVLLAWIFLGEKVAMFHVVSIGLVLSGIVLTTRFAPRVIAPSESLD
ncbi:MAG TPA: DMT family transporter [Burkholderiales bacterium]|nr:DMT family transporter [Burkholderiales bacterium]